MYIYHKNLIPVFEGTLGYEKRIEAAFVQAKNDGIKVLNMNFSIGEVCYYDNSVESLVKALKRIHAGLFTATELNEIREDGLSITNILTN